MGGGAMGGGVMGVGVMGISFLSFYLLRWHSFHDSLIFIVEWGCQGDH